MNRSRLAFLLAAVSLASCDFSPKTPGGPPENYPAIIKDSMERRARAEREWRRMLDAYNVPQTPPDLYPVTYTPRSLLGVSGGMKVVGAGPSDPTDEMTLREAARSFLDRWRDLIGADPAAVSLVRASQARGANRLVYKQANYPFVIVGNYGEMSLSMTADGRLTEFDDRFIPVVELPVKPALDREAAAARLVGRSLTYTDAAGREQHLTVTGPGDTGDKQLVVVPLEKADSLEVHLAWQIVVGKSKTWTVYVDAITGEELKAIQNFQP